MSDKLEIIKAVAPFAAPLTSAIVEQWIKPKLAKLHKYIKTDKTLFEHSLVNKFDEYLQRVYEKNSYMNVIVFQNQRKRLEDIYIPLTVNRTHSKEEILIDDYKQEFIPKFRKVLIKDTAGMGKSTVLKCLFLSCIKKNEGVPIFIELRKLKSNESIVDYVCNELNSIEYEFDKDFILKLIKQGDFIFFLDGYDEIPFTLRDETTHSLQDFISKANDNLYILTSRPESSLASFVDFQEFNIQPLKAEEAFKLLRKYDDGGILSSEIISKLEKKGFQDISEFLTNPLLISLLYKSYEYKPTIPFKKHIFYRQVYDSLFESHDLTKSGSYVREKYTELDIEDFHRVLRSLGFITAKLGQIEFEKDAILSHLKRAKEHCYDLVFKESDFLKDLLSTVPLFNRDGNYFKWTHKAIQEYFAAQFIWLDTKGKQSQILREMVRSDNNEKYFNVLDLYHDMDYKTFRTTIVYDFVCDFIKFYDSSYLSIDRRQISENEIHNRKLVTFAAIFILITSDLSKTLPDMDNRVSKLASLSNELQAALKNFKVSSEFYGLSQSEADSFIIYNHNRLVNQLLSKQKEEIFIRKGEWDVAEELRFIIKSYGMTPPKIYIDLFQRTNTKILVVNDDPNSIVNQKEFFSELTLNLYGDSPAIMDHLDINICRKLKKKIEEDMAREASDNFLFDDL